MNQTKFKEEENRFLMHYPGGFDNPSMQETAKKHNITKWTTFVKENMAEDQFSSDEVVDRLTKLISGSSLVSVFEKTAYRNMMGIMGQVERDEMRNAVKEMLYGNQEKGFGNYCEVLSRYKNDKWPTVTALLYYFNPDYEVLIKPSTVKAALTYFEVEDLKYTSRPNHDFYRSFRDWVNRLKEGAAPELHVDNGAFCGFLMFAVGKFE